MLFNMEMIAYFLSGFETKAELGEDELRIESFIVGDDTDSPSVLRFFSDGDDVICANAENRITVFSASAKDVINTVVSRMEYYNDWERRALNAVAARKQLSEYLSLVSELFPDIREVPRRAGQDTLFNGYYRGPAKAYGPALHDPHPEHTRLPTGSLSG